MIGVPVFTYVAASHLHQFSTVKQAEISARGAARAQGPVMVPIQRCARKSNEDQKQFEDIQRRTNFLVAVRAAR